MSYILNKSDIYGFAHSMCAETKEKGKELFFKYCPYCSGGQSRDKDTFSINMENGTFKCFRATCGKQGHFVELCRDFNYQLDFGTKKEKTFKKLPQKKIEIRNSALEFLKSRGISENTGIRYSITSQTNNPDIIVFPFYDENNVLQFAKYRNSKHKKEDKGAKEWCEKGTKPILFGMAQCIDKTTLTITEGQLDSLTLSECGIKNAVSVPTGAKGFTWLEYCWDWINSFQEVIVFGDWENGKMSLLDELNIKLPKMRIKSVQEKDYLGEKDANDIYRKFGKQAILTAIENAVDISTNCVVEWDDIEDEDLSKRDVLYTNIPSFDRNIGGLFFGQLILLTGKSGSGKSTLGSMLGCEALNQGYKSFFYSGELSKQQFKNWISLQLAGKSNINAIKQTTGKTIYKVTDTAKNGIADFMRGKFYLYDNSYIQDNEMPELLKVVESMICRYGVRFIFLDNLMTAMQDVKEVEKYNMQSQFVRKLKLMADTYNVLIILVAHSRKSNNATFDNDDIFGSSEIVNRVDLVMSYSRVMQKEDGSVKHNSELVVSKNRLTSDLISTKEPVKLIYSISSKRIIEFGYKDKKFNWEYAKQIIPEHLQEEPPF